MTRDEELEKEEREKYNYVVNEKGYGSDYERKVQIERMVGGLGDVSVAYLNILSELKRGRFAEDSFIEDSFKVLDIGSGPGGVMAWLFSEHGADVYGIDISDAFVEYAKSNFPFLENNFVGNASNMHMFEDNSFDLVQHLDGMEHIPVEWEEDCLKEAVRVSNKYIFYENACQDAHADNWMAEKDYTKAHINIKSPSEWVEFYKSHTEELNYEIIHKYEDSSLHQAIILRKNK